MVARVCRDPTRRILRFSGSILAKMRFWTQNFDRFSIGTTFFECQNPSIPVGLTLRGQNLGSGVVQKREKVIFLGLRSKIHVVNHGKNWAFQDRNSDFYRFLMGL